MTQKQGVLPVSPSTEQRQLSRIPPGGERIDPLALVFIALDDLNVSVQRVITLMEAQIEEGGLWSPGSFTVTQPITHFDRIPQPLFGLALFNNGPGAFNICVNTRASVATTVRANQPFSLSFRTAQIKDFWIDQVEGANPVVDISGSY